MWLPSTRTMPKPRLAAPGSIPITTCMGSDSGKRLGCLRKLAWTSLTSSCSERTALEEAETGSDVGWRRLTHLDTSALRLHRQLGGLDLDPGGLQRLAHRAQVARLGEHPQQVAVLLHVLGAGVDRRDQVVLAIAGAVDDDRPRFSKIQATEPGSPRLPPCLVKAWRTSALVRLRLSVSASTRTAAPPGP